MQHTWEADKQETGWIDWQAYNFMTFNDSKTLAFMFSYTQVNLAHFNIIDSLTTL